MTTVLIDTFEVGDQLIWEPRNPRAFEHITVVAVSGDQVQTDGSRGTWWNDVTRMREACVHRKADNEQA